MNKKKRNYRMICLLITLCVYAMVWAGPTVADAGGVIDQDTHWTLDDSPVLVESTAVVTADAQLVISPGVVVAFSEGASLEIEEGALYAKGTVQAPILFTSANDLEGQPAAAGDWGSIVLGPGTRIAGTLLENLEVRYGHGIQVESSSPRLNHILLEYNAGAAIDLDLSASPTGVGLVALNNDINGIRVPVGQITGDVVWALRGIPYVVEQGRVRVGRPDYSIIPQEITLAAGVTAELELVIPETAPAGGLEVDLTSSVPGVLQTEPLATIPEGGDRTSFTVEAVAVGHSVVSASHPALGLATADIHVVAAPALAVSPLDSRVGIGESLQFYIVLSEPAGVGGLTISLEADPVDVIDVPDQVFIAEGVAAAQFSVTGTAHGMTMLHLEAEGYLSVSTTVEVVPPSIELPTSIYVAPGVTRSVPIGLSHPAPAGGLEIQLEADEPGIFDVQSSVSIADGELTGQFELTGISAGQTGLTASAENFATADATVVVGELTLRLGPDVNPWLPVGIGHAFSVHLSDTAPPGGLTVEVTLDNPDTAAFSPTELYIPAGQTQATESLYLEGMEVGEVELTMDFEGGGSAKLYGARYRGAGNSVFP